MFGLKFMKYLLKVPTLIFIVAFVVLNMQDTSFYYSPLADPLELPLWALGLTLFTVGFLVGALLVWVNDWPARRELKKLRKSAAQALIEKESQEESDYDDDKLSSQNLLRD